LNATMIFRVPQNPILLLIIIRLFYIGMLFLDGDVLKI
jgi:hypothetical protein